jgi:DNA-binding transcriptional ArsR family regulator
MVKFQDRLDMTFAALADPTRRAILARLASGGASVTELAEPHRMSVPAVVKHLGVLSDAGLIKTEKTGRVRRCALSPAPLRPAAEWIGFYQQFWERQFDYLEEYLHDLTGQPAAPRRSRPRRRSRKA